MEIRLVCRFAAAGYLYIGQIREILSWSGNTPSSKKSLTMDNIGCNKENEANSENICGSEKKEKEKEANFSRKVSFIRESVSDSGVPERKFSGSRAVDTTKRSSVPSQEAELEHGQASYIKRYPIEDENLVSFDEKVPATINLLSSTQKEKLIHFFSHLLDSDHDDLTSEQDFENFSEKLRRYADWSTNSPQFLIMVQVQQGFLDTFLSSDIEIEGDEISVSWKRYVSLEEWLNTWGLLVSKATNLNDFPLWLHYLPKLLFQAINKSGSGIISRDELGSFYSSILGFSTQRVGEILDEAFNSLTSNGDHPIAYSVYRLAFTNFLLGRYPNGPGQYLFGCVTKRPDSFPIDYSALNCQPEDREHYTPDKKSNRFSVVV